MGKEEEDSSGPPAYPHSEQPAQASNAPQTQIPDRVLHQADAAAASATAEETPRTPRGPLPPVEDAPPPPYSAGDYGQVDFQQNGFNTGAKVAADGRVDISINQKSTRLTSLLAPALRHQLDIQRQESPEPQIPEGLGYVSGLPPPSMNIVIQIVGSRGDVQPFVALGQILKNKFNHRVRLATHPVFRDFVTDNGLEFFSIGGDPAELMAFMVKNPGLMPSFDTVRSGDIGKRRRGIYEIVNGCWRSCIEPGDGTGTPASDEMLENQGFDSAISLGDPSAKPFVADAIIANPPSFAHIHIAEKMGIPLHLMFTMPWSPTQSFPHPLANIVSSNTDAGMTNFLSYILVELLTWQGVGDVINRFREKVLRLEPISILWAPGNLNRLRIPWTYCWSPALIPKPADWAKFIDISGFFFLNLATNYTPDADLAEFLEAGPPPVYIGFGSIVVDDPNAMTQLIFEAVKKTGHRALVSKGWGGLSGDEMGVPEGVFMLGNCPHDWLFKKVSCVVHHGGAGTTAAGISAGRPTVVVPFFGDQKFWGDMLHRAGAGPKPIPSKDLTSENLAEAIQEALKPESLDRAKEMSDKIMHESGSESGAESFHRHLSVDDLRCTICPGRVAVWRVKRTKVRLSALAATVLSNEGLLNFSELKLYRPREYDVDLGPPEPISGGAAALIGTISNMTSGFTDYPSEMLKAFKSAKATRTERAAPSAADASGGADSSTQASTTDLSSPPPEPNVLVTEPEDLKSDTEDVSAGSRVAASSTENTLSPRASLVPTPRDSHRSVLSESPSRSRSGSASSQGARSSSRSVAQQFTVESAIGTAKATGNIVAAGVKSPLDFTLSLARGFHNAPKLYGDTTVRPTEKVTGFSSGLKVAAKEFGYGFYDGITGLVTQPLQGARDEGVAGFSKGLFKGSMGLVLKPGASIWALPGYTMKGLYAEIVKNFGKSTTNFIIAARTAQGYEEWSMSDAGERERIIAAWKSNNFESNPKVQQARRTSALADDNPKSKYYDENGDLIRGWKATKNLSWEERKVLSRLKKEGKTTAKGKNIDDEQTAVATPPIDATASVIPTGVATATEDEFEQAIRTAVQETSNDDPEEDAAIEAALRASVRELRDNKRKERERRAQESGPSDAYNRAIAGDAADRQPTATSRSQQESGVVRKGGREPTDNNEHDKELEEALRRSMHEHQVGQSGRQAANDVDSAYITDEDDDNYKRALEESMRTHGPGATTAGSVSASRVPPALPARGTGTDGAEHAQTADDDAELLEAIRISEQESRQREQELEKQKTEEEIVLEYVKKQSMQEEEYRRGR